MLNLDIEGRHRTLISRLMLEIEGVHCDLLYLVVVFCFR